MYLQTRRYHNERSLSLQYSHNIHERTRHLLYYEGDAVVEECERSILSSTCRCNTYRKEIGHRRHDAEKELSLIHISEPTRLLSISYAVFCLKKKKNALQ